MSINALAGDIALPGCAVTEPVSEFFLGGAPFFEGGDAGPGAGSGDAFDRVEPAFIGHKSAIAATAAEVVVPRGDQAFAARETRLGAVGVHGVEQHLAHPSVASFPHPLKRIQASTTPAAMCGHFVTGWSRCRTAGVNR